MTVFDIKTTRITHIPIGKLIASVGERLSLHVGAGHAWCSIMGTGSLIRLWAKFWGRSGSGGRAHGWHLWETLGRSLGYKTMEASSPKHRGETAVAS